MTSSPWTSTASGPTAEHRRGRSRRWLFRLAAVVGSVLVMLVVLETGFRLYDAMFGGFPFLWDPALASRKQTKLCNPFLLFRGGWEDYRRRAKTPEQVIDPKGRELVRIVCLGGSTTQDVTAFVEEQITYPSELQRLLNERLSGENVVVETINAGFAAHSTLHMLILLETELLDLRPDVLIVYENINDLTANYFPGPTTPAYASKFLHPYYLPPEMTVERATLLDHSRFYTWAKARMRTVVNRGIRYTDEPLDLPHAEVFRRNLEMIIAVAQAHGIDVVLGQQAFAADQELFERHFCSKSYNREIVYPRIDQLTRHFERYNQIVREVAEAHELPCVNVYERLKYRHELFADVVHLHAAGSKEVAAEFAKRLWEDVEFQRILTRKRGQRPVIAKEPETEQDSIREEVGP
ncbi:MAG: SGNH/GDSL hydrolase family protein [Gemmatales bacterium]|nr:SGNH/GDSL hydrolase family protein [Gemmatales bacterium]MDW8386773.1 SGNH/GDSL hydrolase family protein [Gemmatales bacterium]